MDPFDALDRATEEAGRRVRLVTDDQWDRSTPCAGWTVRDLVNHLVRGNVMSVMLLDGASTEEVMQMFRTAEPEADLIGAYADSAKAQNAAFRAPGALDQTVHHPMGDIPATLFLQFRTGTRRCTPGTSRARSTRTMNSTASSSRCSTTACSRWRR